MQSYLSWWSSRQHTIKTNTRKSSCVNAHRPRRIKYSICYPRWGTPLARSDGGGGGTWGWVPPVAEVRLPSQVQPGGYPRWGTPQQGYPLAGVPPPSRGTSLQGYPPARSDGGTRGGGTPAGVLPHLDLARVPPPPSGPGWGTPPPLGVDRQTDGWMDGGRDGQTRVKT